MGGGQVGRILLFQTLKVTIYHRKRPVRLVLLKGGEEGGGWTEEIFFLEGEVLPPSTKRKKRKKKNHPVIGIENKEKETKRERRVVKSVVFYGWCCQLGELTSIYKTPLPLVPAPHPTFPSLFPII